MLGDAAKRSVVQVVGCLLQQIPDNFAASLKTLAKHAQDPSIDNLFKDKDARNVSDAAIQNTLQVKAHTILRDGHSQLCRNHVTAKDLAKRAHELGLAEGHHHLAMFKQQMEESEEIAAINLKMANLVALQAIAQEGMQIPNQLIELIPRIHPCLREAFEVTTDVCADTVVIADDEEVV